MNLEERRSPSVAKHSPSPNFECSTCFSRFTRSEHLHRHMLSHSEKRLFECSFCPLSFSRRDALLRHLRTCKKRTSSGSAIPALKKLKRGRKRISCHKCAQLKKKCSHDLPCEGCVQTNQPCTYDDPKQDSCTPTPSERRDRYYDTTDSLQVADESRLCPPGDTLPWPVPASFDPMHAEDDDPSLSAEEDLSWLLADEPDPVATFNNDLLPSAEEDLCWLPLAGSNLVHAADKDSLPSPGHDLSRSISTKFEAPVGTNTTVSNPKASNADTATSPPQSYGVWHDTRQDTHYAPGLIPHPRNLQWDLGPFSGGLPSLSGFECRFGFLVRFTSSDGFANSFDCGNSVERKRLMQALIDSKPVPSIGSPHRTLPSTTLSATPGASLGPGGHFGWNMPDGSVDDMPRTSHDAGRLGSTPPGGDDLVRPGHSLAQKSREIIEGIRHVITHQRANGSISLSWSPTEAEACRQFFSPQSLEKYLVVFWSSWYPNWPVFHKPTFGAARKPATLVAAMALIGATLGSNKSESDQATKWMGAVEDWVFSAPEFCEDAIVQTGSLWADANVKARLDALRAAYAVVLFMTWEGNRSQKNRARRNRFTQTIAVARSLLRLPLTHGDLSAYMASDDMIRSWRTFIFKEELIRTVLYVFMLDCAYVMFNNSAPRMVVHELCLSVSCPEVCFQVSDVCTWQLHLETWAESRIGKMQPQMAKIIEDITSDHISMDQLATFRQMSVLNFFAVANAFQGLIFYYRCSTPQTSEAAPILRGLTNWKRGWLSRKPVLGEYEVYCVSPCDAWKRIGFMRYALEFWALAWVICRQVRNKRGLTGSQAHHTGDETSRGFLSSFDDSDMTQVHDLIVKFEGVNLIEGGL